MLKFSAASLTKSATCHPDLQKIFSVVIKYFDCVYIYGYRGQAEQHKAFIEGKSKLQWPNSAHNKTPSMAADVAPYDNELKIDWNNIKRFYYFAGFVKAIAKMLKENGEITHDLIWGGDWDDDTEVKDNSFNDLVHYQLSE